MHRELVGETWLASLIAQTCNGRGATPLCRVCDAGDIREAMKLYGSRGGFLDSLPPETRKG